jgi:hypothetical protein
LRAKDSELSGLLAFAPCSALNFTRQDDAEFANSDDAVKFTAFYVKIGFLGGENLKI